METGSNRYAPSKGTAPALDPTLSPDPRCPGNRGNPTLDPTTDTPIPSPEGTDYLASHFRRSRSCSMQRALEGYSQS